MNNLEYIEMLKQFVSKEKKENTESLENACILEVLQKYQDWKRTKSPNYCVTPVIFNIKELQEEIRKKMKQEKSENIMPIMVDELFYVLFERFLRDRGIKGSSIATYFNQLRGALRWGSKHGTKLSETFDVFHVEPFEKTKIALSADEVSHIYHFEIEKNFCKSKTGRKMRDEHIENLKRVRDMFVLSCNLGQRYSDMRRIIPSCFDETKTTFTITQQKTGSKGIVKIDDFCIDKNVTREILERYNYNAPYNTSISNYNHYLHELLSKLGGRFEQEQINEVKENGVVKREVVKRKDLITSHTSRRTFVTYNIMRHKSEAEIRQCTGHKEGKAFLKYVLME